MLEIFKDHTLPLELFLFAGQQKFRDLLDLLQSYEYASSLFHLTPQQQEDLVAVFMTSSVPPSFTVIQKKVGACLLDVLVPQRTAGDLSNTSFLPSSRVAEHLLCLPGCQSPPVSTIPLLRHSHSNSGALYISVSVD